MSLSLRGAASAIVAYSFPGVKKRFDSAAQWHKSTHGIEPDYGLFWNLCVNAAFSEPAEKGGKIPSVSCIPHTDSRNGISVCVLFIYLLAGCECLCIYYSIH